MRFEPFALKHALVGESQPVAAHHLSDSYCEPLSVRELLSLEPDGVERFLGHTLGYPGFRGSEELRVTIAGLYPGLDPGHIVPANGADDSIFAFMLACLERGAHVVVQVPAYQALFEVARGAGCRVDFWRGDPDRGWRFDLDALRDLLRPDTRLVVINVPHNPTGYTMPAGDLAALFELAEQRGFLVLSDEIYRGLELDPAAALTPAACMSERGISVGSMSKSFGLPGLRVGWMATRNADVLEALGNFQQYMNSFVSLGGELLATVALRHREHILGRNRDLIRANIERTGGFFQRHAELFDWSPPSAGTVRFATLRRGSADALCAALLERASVQLASGRSFGCADRYVRIGLGRRAVPAALDAFERFLGAEQW